MIPPFKRLEWKPSTVSWLSFVLMGLIVAGIGLSGTAHVVNYLEVRMAAHGIEHNQEVAEALAPGLARIIEAGRDEAPGTVSDAIGAYRSFGFRIFIVDRERGLLIADSDPSHGRMVPIAQSWLAHAVVLGAHEKPFPVQTSLGAAQAIGEDLHPLLIWLHALPVGNGERWVLGVARDQKTLADFMGDLHWHLDAVMLLTYVLITLLGYWSMRSIGRTYERRLESQVRERTRALEAAHREMLDKARLATIGQTASVLAHEMRNPLASIKLALSGVKGSPNLGGREHRRVELVVGEVDRLDALLSETLQYVRPVKLSAAPVELDGLLSRVLQQQEPLIEEKRISVERTVCDACTATRLDEAQMHQVLLNLVKNAVEASPEGTRILISLVREADDFLLQITNGGDLLDAETRQRAFEPFYTTKPKGTGLGLGLVKRVIEEHGGSVELSSDSSFGNRLTLRLPFDPS